MPVGRPTKYKPAYCKEIVAYFQTAADAPTRELAPVVTTTDGEKPSVKTETRRICAELPTLEGFAGSIGVASFTLRQWAEKHEEFRVAYARAQDIQFRLLTDRGLTRQYDPTAFLFVAKNITWMKDRTAVDQRFVDKDGNDRNLLSEIDAAVAAADAVSG